MWSDEPHILVTDGLHAGVEPTGGQVVDHLREHPIDGVQVAAMHPEAVRRSVRFLGEQEMGQAFIPRITEAVQSFDNPDQHAARDFLEYCAGMKIWLGIDIHNNPSPGLNYIAVGSRVKPEQLAVASVLGIRYVEVMPEYPFFRFFNRFLSVDVSNADTKNPLMNVAYWRQKLGEIASLGQSGMHELGMDTYKSLDYFYKLDIMRQDENGKPSKERIQTIAKYYEGTYIGEPTQQATDLPERFRVITKRYGVPEDKIRVAYWDDTNMSTERLEYGLRADGRMRRDCFGGLLLTCSPPMLTSALWDPSTTYDHPNFEYVFE